MARLFDDAASDGLENLTTPITGVPLTLACWFRSDSLTLKQILMQVGTDGSGANLYSLRLAGNAGGDPVQACTTAGGETFASTTSGYSADTWHHAAAVFASNTSRIVYLDGGNSAEGTTNRVPSGINALSLGIELDNTFPFSGRLAEAGLWNIALSAAQIALLAAGVSPLRIRPDALKGYWPLYAIGSPEPDYSGGTLYPLTVDGATIADHAPVQPTFGFDVGWQAVLGGAAPPSGRIMSSLTYHGGLAGDGGIAGQGGGLAA